MPRGRRNIAGPLEALANNRKQLEKKHSAVIAMIRRELGQVTSIAHTRQPVHFGSSLRLDLQSVPYQRDGLWWANFAVQKGTNTCGALEVECDVNFNAGELADAMIEACANAHETQLQGSIWKVTAQRQYVVWHTRRPPGVMDA